MALVASLCHKYGIVPSNETVIPHNQIITNRSCPGGLDVDRIIKQASILYFNDQTMLQKPMVSAVRGDLYLYMSVESESKNLYIHVDGVYKRLPDGVEATHLSPIQVTDKGEFKVTVFNEESGRTFFGTSKDAFDWQFTEIKV